MAPHHLRTHPLVLRHLTVRRTERVNARTMRVTLTGEQLDAFVAAGRTQPPFDSPAFDDHVKLVLTDDGRVEDALPRQLPHGIEWLPSENRLTRDYTPRRVDRAARELDLDFVLGHDGPAARWSLTAAPGDPAWVVGPKSSTVLPDELDWIVLLGDETALPAIARFLEERPTPAPAEIHVLVTDPAARVELPLGPADRVRWTVTDGHDPEVPLRLLREHDWRPGQGYVWGAGEARAMLPVRRFLRNERGLDRSRTDVTGYWHHRAPEPADSTPAPTAPAGAHDETRAGDPAATALGWFAVRAALRLPVLDTLARGAARLGPLAAAAGTTPERLAPLLAVLAARGLVTETDGEHALAEAGRELVEDDHARESYDGFDAELLRSLTELDTTLRGGEPSWRLTHGRTLHESAEADPEVLAELVEHADALGYVLDALIAEPVVRAADALTLHGPAAAVVADVLRDRGIASALTVTGSPAALEQLRPRVRAGDVAFAERPARNGPVIAALALGHRTDAEATALLAELRDVTEALVVVESLRPDSLGPAAADERLLRLAMTGSPPRTADAVAALAAAAGWRRESAVPLGWGFEALVLRPAPEPAEG
ncbi:siderophore-interacting protein [Streptomyces spiramenti]|uniref:Siderophore-interacting protein n=1 Tax=Streptomyces spiramenti TaxID=2720606 RepID=A0ABX1ALZ7_9ACTN|nr:siderophore-interacting protein [Streptomyces spiramenti]NJP67051.1 siderophore-interacting protein [Streptomyces spiramenti]